MFHFALWLSILMSSRKPLLDQSKCFITCMKRNGLFQNNLGLKSTHKWLNVESIIPMISLPNLASTNVRNIFWFNNNMDGSRVVMKEENHPFHCDWKKKHLKVKSTSFLKKEGLMDKKKLLVPHHSKAFSCLWKTPLSMTRLCLLASRSSLSLFPGKKSRTYLVTKINNYPTP